jgi:hypothetical protein
VLFGCCSDHNAFSLAEQGRRAACPDRMQPNAAVGDGGGMTSTILAALGAAVLILHTASRLPAALADLLRACLPLVQAARDLWAALTDDDQRDI